jgi:3-dehydroquinate synthase
MAEGSAKERIEKLLKKYNLPTEDPFTVEELMKFVVSDKKRRGDVTRIVRVSEIGSYRFEEVDDAALRRIIEKRKI